MNNLPSIRTIEYNFRGIILNVAFTYYAGSPGREPTHADPGYPADPPEVEIHEVTTQPPRGNAPSLPVSVDIEGIIVDSVPLADLIAEHIIANQLDHF